MRPQMGAVRQARRAVSVEASISSSNAFAVPASQPNGFKPLAVGHITALSSIRTLSSNSLMVSRCRGFGRMERGCSKPLTHDCCTQRSQLSYFRTVGRFAKARAAEGFDTRCLDPELLRAGAIPQSPALSVTVRAGVAPWTLSSCAHSTSARLDTMTPHHSPWVFAYPFGAKWPREKGPQKAACTNSQVPGIR